MKRIWTAGRPTRSVNLTRAGYLHARRPGWMDGTATVRTVVRTLLHRRPAPTRVGRSASTPVTEGDARETALALTTAVLHGTPEIFRLVMETADKPLAVLQLASMHTARFGSAHTDPLRVALLSLIERLEMTEQSLVRVDVVIDVLTQLTTDHAPEPAAIQLQQFAIAMTEEGQ